MNPRKFTPTLEGKPSFYFADMQEHINGEYVLLEEYQKIESEKWDLTDKHSEAVIKYLLLLVENQKLKFENEKLSDIINSEPFDHSLLEY